MKTITSLSGLIGGYLEDGESLSPVGGSGDGVGLFIVSDDNGLVPGAPSTSTDPFSRLPPELAAPPPGEGIEILRKSSSPLITAYLQGYRNPDLLTKLVEHSGIQEKGSAFPKDFFDPDALSAGNYIDKLVRQLEAEQDQKRKMREQMPAHGGPGLPSASGGAAPARTAAPPVVRATSVGGAVPPVGLNVAALRQQAALNAAAINAAAAKRTKWDGTGK
eukprot:gene19119-25726_t